MITFRRLLFAYVSAIFVMACRENGFTSSCRSTLEVLQQICTALAPTVQWYFGLPVAQKIGYGLLFATVPMQLAAKLLK